MYPYSYLSTPRVSIEILTAQQSRMHACMHARIDNKSPRTSAPYVGNAQTEKRDTKHCCISYCTYPGILYSITTRYTKKMNDTSRQYYYARSNNRRYIIATIGSISNNRKCYLNRRVNSSKMLLAHIVAFRRVNLRSKQNASELHRALGEMDPPTNDPPAPPPSPRGTCGGLVRTTYVRMTYAKMVPRAPLVVLKWTSSKLKFQRMYFF